MKVGQIFRYYGEAGRFRFPDTGNALLLKSTRSVKVKDQTKYLTTSRLEIVLVLKNLLCCIPILHREAVIGIINDTAAMPEPLTTQNAVSTEVIVQGRFNISNIVAVV